jgi:hypothetical protein
MVAVFLRGELTSARFGPELRAAMGRHGVAERVVTEPDLDDEAENDVRRRILGGVDGYRDDYLDDFPDDVRWDWMAIIAAELAEVRYIDYSYWNELSGGTRLAVDAAPRVRAGVAPFGFPSEALELAEALAAGAVFPPLILVTTGPGGGLVVLEGHSRLTAYMLVPDLLPPEMEVLAGSSPTMTRWDSGTAGDRGAGHPR